MLFIYVLLFNKEKSIIVDTETLHKRHLLNIMEAVSSVSTTVMISATGEMSGYYILCSKLLAYANNMVPKNQLSSI